ncbi:MAG: helix-turn-helix transcriptional regulator [Candidatus Omnitrophica bacterium]|nr:helix-turn-helix transcriptional regulator [Candidatus Omnitrophota bacterium]
MSQKVLALGLKVKQSTVSKWEQGKRTPGMKKISLIAQSLRTSISSLVKYKKENVLLSHDLAVRLLDQLNAASFIVERLIKGDTPDRGVLIAAQKQIRDAVKILRSSR